MVEILSIKFIRSKNCSRMVTESMLEHLTLDDSCVDHQRSGSDRYLIPCVNTSREWDSLFSFISRVAIIERVIRNGQSSSLFSENLSLPDCFSPIFYLRFVYNGGWIYLLRLNNPLCVECRGERERGERDLHSCREIRSMFRIIKKISNRRAQDLVLISALMEILEILYMQADREVINLS